MHQQGWKIDCSLAYNIEIDAQSPTEMKNKKAVKFLIPLRYILSRNKFQTQQSKFPRFAFGQLFFISL